MDVGGTQRRAKEKEQQELLDAMNGEDEILMKTAQKSPERQFAQIDDKNPKESKKSP